MNTPTLRRSATAATALLTGVAFGSLLITGLSASVPTDVNSTSMTISPTDGVCTLPEAINAANADVASGAAVGECAAGGCGTIGAGTFGVHAVTVDVRDGTLSDSASFMWTVALPNIPPTLNNPGDQSSVEGETPSVAVSASNPDGDVLTFSVSGLPPGLSMDQDTGAITRDARDGKRGQLRRRLGRH